MPEAIRIHRCTLRNRTIVRQVLHRWILCGVVAILGPFSLSRMEVVTDSKTSTTQSPALSTLGCGHVRGHSGLVLASPWWTQALPAHNNHSPSCSMTKQCLFKSYDSSNVDPGKEAVCPIEQWMSIASSGTRTMGGSSALFIDCGNCAGRCTLSRLGVNRWDTPGARQDEGIYR
jgi:hypothetical protein